MKCKTIMGPQSCSILGQFSGPSGGPFWVADFGILGRVSGKEFILGRGLARVLGCGFWENRKSSYSECREILGKG